MTDNLESKITAAVMKALQEKEEFSNVARPKATKASTATQGAWNINEEPKASTATQGSWDATDTPGGVSSRAKKVWTKADIEKAAFAVQKALEKAEFFNRKIEGEAKPAANKATSTTYVEPQPSAATQGAWDTTGTPGGLESATKEVWTKDELAKVALSVQKALENAEFYNRKLEGEVKPSANKTTSATIVEKIPAANKATSDTLVDTSKVSASTIPAYKDAEPENKKKMSASVCAQILTNVYKLNK